MKTAEKDAQELIILLIGEGTILDYPSVYEKVMQIRREQHEATMREVRKTVGDESGRFVIFEDTQED